jgi:hypothetical protein
MFLFLLRQPLCCRAFHLARRDHVEHLRNCGIYFAWHNAEPGCSAANSISLKPVLFSTRAFGDMGNEDALRAWPRRCQAAALQGGESLQRECIAGTSLSPALRDGGLGSLRITGAGGSVTTGCADNSCNAFCTDCNFS